MEKNTIPTDAESTALYAAFVSRDPRFDGRFWVAVTSTGNYCRPVCRVRPPRKENCRFFANPAQAEKEGYRPCLRCRPELAPGNPVDMERHRLADVAALCLESGLGEDVSLEDLALRLGTSSRQLRRVFAVRFGVTPVDYAQTQRLLQAKKLLQDTCLPITEVAYAAGFKSLRRFNAVIKERYGMAAGEVRRASGIQNEPSALRIRLAYRPPLDWELILRFFTDRTVAGVEKVVKAPDLVHGGEPGVFRYVRAVRFRARETALKAEQDITGWLSVTHVPKEHCVCVELSPGLVRTAPLVGTRVRRMFDLRCDPEAVAHVLGPLAKGREGLRLPGAFDAFETSVRAILGQQISVKAATTLAGRMATAYGEQVQTPFPGVDRVFPSPERLATLEEGALAGIGMPLGRARCIIQLAREVQEGRIDLECPVDVPEIRQKLLALPGIGPWTADYLCMRALAWPDAFPAADLGIKKALGEQKPERTQALAEKWRPWRSYATLHLWLGPKQAHLDEEGDKQ